MQDKLKSLCSGIVLATATVAFPSQAFAYTCQDYYASREAHEASIAAYDEANIEDQYAKAMDDWRTCLDRGNPDEDIWCDQEYESITELISQEEQFLLLDISIKHSEMEMISNQLASDGITCPP